MLGWILAVGLAASPQPPLMFNFFDAADLLGDCAASDAAAPVRRSLCFGYVAGALDQVLMQQSLLDPRDRTVCPPATLTLNAAVSAVLDHASWAARERGLGASGLVKFTLEQTYPCRSDREPM